MVVYNIGVLEHFETENCIWVFLSDFRTNVPKYIFINVQYNLGLVIIQNISKPECLNSVCGIIYNSNNDVVSSNLVR